MGRRIYGAVGLVIGAAVVLCLTGCTTADLQASLVDGAFELVFRSGY